MSAVNGWVFKTLFSPKKNSTRIVSQYSLYRIWAGNSPDLRGYQEQNQHPKTTIGAVIKERFLEHGEAAGTCLFGRTI